jgi:hypothetical protein
MNIEYVTDPVLVPGLRCPSCKARVRVIRIASTSKSEFAVALAEPVAWIALAVAACLGYLWQTIWGITLVLLVLGPIAAVYLYLRGITNSSFFCGNCTAELTYRAVSRGKLS